MMTTTQPKRFTLQEYHRLIEGGFFDQRVGVAQPRHRIELIRGEIMQMAAKGTYHSVCCSNLNRELVILVRNQGIVRCQDPIAIPHLNSEPEPDFVIAQPKADQYLSTHPQPTDIFLIIEIADSTLLYDRETKLPLYAEAGIPHYWLFNLVEQQLEVYREPYQTLQENFNYRQTQIFLPDQAIPLPQFPQLVLNLANIFPTV